MKYKTSYALVGIIITLIGVGFSAVAFIEMGELAAAIMLGSAILLIWIYRLIFGRNLDVEDAEGEQ